jgi:hypothetical protein
VDALAGGPLLVPRPGQRVGLQNADPGCDLLVSRRGVSAGVAGCAVVVWSLMYISENTVKNDIRNILEKLQLHSRMQAVVYAVREKLLDIT